MHEEHYVFPTNFIYFNHVYKSFNDFIMKIKNFMKYLKEGVFKYFKNFAKFLSISFQSEIFHRASLIVYDQYCPSTACSSSTVLYNLYTP